jgi:hypothetical protein
MNSLKPEEIVQYAMKVIVVMIAAYIAPLAINPNQLFVGIWS